MEKEILVICPTCTARKKIPVPEDIIKAKESGETSVYINPGLVCEHEFYAYVDKNFAVRGYLALDFSKGKDPYEIKKIEIMNKVNDLNLEIDNVLQYISQKDLRSLIFASFFGSPIIFIEDNPDQERFQVVYALIGKICSNLIKRSKIFPPVKYIEFEKNKKEQLDYFTVYNVMYKISVKKPFTNTDSEPFDRIFDILRDKSKSLRLRLVYAKNFVDYMVKFIDDVRIQQSEKNDKIVKNLKKRYPRHQEKINSANIEIIKLQLAYQKRMQENAVKNYSEKVFD